MDAEWFHGLWREVKASTQAVVAARMGVSRSTLTVLLNGSGAYGAGQARTDGMERRYRQAFEQIECPHDGKTVGADHCREKALRQAPTHNPLQLNHWKTCQGCKFKPASTGPKLPKARAVEVPIAFLDDKTMPLPEVGAPQIDLTLKEVA